MTAALQYANGARSGIDCRQPRPPMLAISVLCGHGKGSAFTMATLCGCTALMSVHAPGNAAPNAASACALASPRRHAGTQRRRLMEPPRSRSLTMALVSDTDSGRSKCRWGKTSVAMTFINDGDVPARLFWVDDANHEASYGVVMPGARVVERPILVITGGCVSCWASATTRKMVRFCSTCTPMSWLRTRASAASHSGSCNSSMSSMRCRLVESVKRASTIRTQLPSWWTLKIAPKAVTIRKVGASAERVVGVLHPAGSRVANSTHQLVVDGVRNGDLITVQRAATGEVIMQHLVNDVNVRPCDMEGGTATAVTAPTPREDTPQQMSSKRKCAHWRCGETRRAKRSMRCVERWRSSRRLTLLWSIASTERQSRTTSRRRRQLSNDMGSKRATSSGADGDGAYAQMKRPLPTTSCVEPWIVVPIGILRQCGLSTCVAEGAPSHSPAVIFSTDGREHT